MSVEVPLLCFNDVYRVSQKYVPQPNAPEYDRSTAGGAADKDDDGPRISVSQFAQTLLSEREKWADSPRSSTGSKDGGSGGDGGLQKEGLVLFAGDVFNPSTESSISRGSHMVPVLNALKLDCACVGNHDFDFGFPHLTKLIGDTQFPWLLSNIVDTTTGKQPEPLRRFWVTERCGARIGVIGLVEEDWIATIPSWPEEFKYRPMKDVAIELSKELRDPKGEHRVDIIIALTHCRVPNDIRLANELGAVADKPGVENEHGVDLLIGGHDHIYYIGKGAGEWDGWAGERGAKGTEADQGVRLIKSGTDFRDLTSARLTLSVPNDTAVRRRTITSLKGKHHYILPSDEASPSFDTMLKHLLSSVSATLSKPVCFTLMPFDARSEKVRTSETGLGNWVADVLLHAYAESALDSGKNWVMDEGKGEEQQPGAEKVEKPDTKDGPGAKADAVIICGGTLRGDSQYGPGKITLGDILEILPFEDPVVCIEIDGKGIWDTMEAALSKYPSQEGRFPIVSGLSVVWDSRLPPNKRVKSIHLIKVPDEGSEDDEDEVEFDKVEDIVDFVEQEDGTRIEVRRKGFEQGEEVKNESGGRTYRIITRQYMADGYDGFKPLTNRHFIIDDENGQIMSSVIRSFLLGSSYIFRHKQLVESHERHLSTRTDKLLDKARREHQSPPGTGHHFGGGAGGGPGGGFSTRDGSVAGSPRSIMSQLAGGVGGAGGAGGSVGRPPWGCVSTHSQMSLDEAMSDIDTDDDRSSNKMREDLSAQPSSAKHPAGDNHPANDDPLLLSPISEASGMSFASGSTSATGQLRRHVVQHSWASIRNALWIAKHEHMSEIDGCEGDSMRRHRPEVEAKLSQIIKEKEGKTTDNGRPSQSESAAKPVAVPRKDGNGSGAPAGTDPHGDETPRAGGVPPAAADLPVHQSTFISQQVQEELKHLASELAIVCPLIDGRMKDLADEDGSS